jgi:hypothetical protein
MLKKTPISSSNAFKGEVYEDVFGELQEVGWARLMITNASSTSPLSLDGTFTTNDGMFHIREISRYKIAKREYDINIASPFSRPVEQRKSNLMVFKDEPSHYHDDHVNLHQSGSKHGCGNDHIDNTEARLKYENFLDDQASHGSRFSKRAGVGCPVSKLVLPIVVYPNSGSCRRLYIYRCPWRHSCGIIANPVERQPSI